MDFQLPFILPALCLFLSFLVLLAKQWEKSRARPMEASTYRQHAPLNRPPSSSNNNKTRQKIMKKVQIEVTEATKGKKTVDEADIPEMKYLRMVIKETIRLHPLAAYLMPRQCIEQREIGVLVSTRVSIERFEDNDIDFNGGNFQYSPFGAGKRICPGMAFGLSSLQLTLAQLLFHFNWNY